MLTLTLSDFKAHPRKSAAAMRTDEVIFSANGKPLGLYVPFGDEGSENIEKEIVATRARVALAKSQARSRKSGTDKLTQDDINRIIARGRAKTRSSAAHA